MEDGNKQLHALSLVKIEQFKKLSEEESNSNSNSAQESEPQALSSNSSTQLPAAQVKQLKSTWIKASYNSVVKRIYDPPKSIDELKAMLCTRFCDLRPLLELGQSGTIQLEFRTQNQTPYMTIDNEIDLINAFYTCNEIR